MFYDAGRFPFTRDLEASFAMIREEFSKLPKDGFTAWPQRFLYETGWEVFGLYAFGRKMDKNCQLCPHTTAAVERIPGLATAGFSWLAPHTHIKPHVGYTKSVLRCHLGVLIPDGCRLRVGDEVRSWEEGVALVFDDTTEHEVWNDSDRDRAVLLLDFKRSAAM